MKWSLLDRVNLGRIWLTTLPAERRRWRGPVSMRSPRVYYGYDAIPGMDETVAGGMVKLQDLATNFPNALADANIVYLVSSALPHFPVRMIRRAKRGGARLVLNQNGVAYPGWYGPGWQAANRQPREVLELADFVIYQSDFCQRAADRFLGPTRGESTILHNPVPTDRFRPDPDRSSPDDTARVLVAGSHWTRYRVRAAVAAVAHARRDGADLQLEIAGRLCWAETPEIARREAQAWVEEEGLADAVTFSGPYTQRQAVDVFHRSHILLHTKYNDPCPRLVVEAMACGLPVVYSASGGVPELVGDEAGIGVAAPEDYEQDHPPDPRELAAALLALQDDYPRYARAARDRAESQFDTREWLRRHEEIFASLCSGGE